MAERENRTLCDTARSLLFNTDISKVDRYGQKPLEQQHTCRIVYQIEELIQLRIVNGTERNLIYLI